MCTQRNIKFCNAPNENHKQDTEKSQVQPDIEAGKAFLIARLFSRLSYCYACCFQNLTTYYQHSNAGYMKKIAIDKMKVNGCIKIYMKPSK